MLKHHILPSLVRIIFKDILYIPFYTEYDLPSLTFHLDFPFPSIPTSMSSLCLFPGLHQFSFVFLYAEILLYFDLIGSYNL